MLYLHLLGKMALVGIAHFALCVVLYYGRVKEVSPVCRSDFLVFTLPAGLAFGSYFFLAWFGIPSMHRFVKLILVLLIAVFALAISSLCFAMFAFNMWGT